MKNINNSQRTENNGSFVVSWCLGGISGGIGRSITAPFDRIRLIIATTDAHTFKSYPVRRDPISFDSYKRVYQEQGSRAFWRGNTTNVIRYFPTQAFNFAFNDLFQSILQNSHTHLMTNFASGGLAGLFSLLFLHPLDVARILLVNDVGKGQRSYNGPRGIRGLYHGFGIQAAGVVPYRAVYFGLFTSLNESLPFKHYNVCLTIASQLIMAIISVWAAMFVSYPITVLRRRYPMLSDFSEGDVKIDYRGAISCAKQIVKVEGIGALFQGVSNYWSSPRIFASGGTLAVYSILQNHFGGKVNGS